MNFYLKKSDDRKTISRDGLLSNLYIWLSVFKFRGGAEERANLHLPRPNPQKT